ncbi:MULTISPECIES: anthranilate phosphoribosyltransferase [unclassified Paludibacterium]|uniref:anthranilate phosphoribosyltransferase n=1 Tax=unclassified Paludibacterium TaxID=2618429 RepID=UPI001C05C1E9|nr:anthranilate phosphoribosyltransferase [Paludibacterium sp. B53371]BEV71240.1 anthranilate phosphoribosyltransferase [Paludibacterium sp. THUN1379]
MITPQEALNRLIDQNELFYDEMLDLMRQIMRGEISPALTAAILIGLRVKVESVLEIAAAATVMREFSERVPVSRREHLVDTCGTGGDKTHSFNISTAAAFVAAAAGARVAKHGGRSVSSKSGSADVLEILGVNINLNAAAVGECIDRIGIGFMFAPNHHSAMRHVAPIRRELGVRTVFNILGPLTNPAGADNQVMGVFHHDLVGIQARVLKELGSRHVLIVHGMDGLDEITLSDNTWMAELKDGAIHESILDPRDYGFARSELSALRADSAEASAAMIEKVLAGQASAALDIVLINAGAAIYTAGVADSLADGIERAREAVRSGGAQQKLHELITTSQSLAG